MKKVLRFVVGTIIGVVALTLEVVVLIWEGAVRAEAAKMMLDE